jgi:hypothetical protein
MKIKLGFNIIAYSNKTMNSIYFSIPLIMISRGELGFSLTILGICIDVKYKRIEYTNIREEKLYRNESWKEFFEVLIKFK